MTIDQFILDCIHYTSTDLCKYEGKYLSKSQIEQIAEWLEELKMLRLQNHLGRDEALIAGRKEGYNKAIDDFVKLAKEHEFKYGKKDISNCVIGFIEFFAEQLKEGVS